MNDPIVDEVRRVRDEHAARFNYDLDAIFLDIKALEQQSGRKFVTFPPAPQDQASPPTGAPITPPRNPLSSETPSSTEF